MAIGKKTGGRDWKPGESGNPRGRPPQEETATEILRSRVNKEEIADLLIAAAAKGNVTAQKYIYDRLDGMPRQSVQVSGGENPIGLIFVNPGEIAEDTSTTEAS